MHDQHDQIQERERENRVLQTRLPDLGDMPARVLAHNLTRQLLAFARHTHLDSDPTGGRLSTERVLLVENDATVATIMALTLESAGYEVELVDGPAAALTIMSAAGNHFDLLVSDVVMHGMRGPELVDELGRRGLKPRVLFVPGYGPDLFGDTVDTGEHPVLEKPFNSEALLSTVRSLLKAPR